MTILRHFGQSAGCLRRLEPGFVLAGIVLLAGCSEPPQPRNFADFMEDRIAREGTLARCNADREATLYDIECAAARRAAAAIALRHERERREALERESEVKLAALRNQIEAREAQARVAAEQARLASDPLTVGPGAVGNPVAAAGVSGVPGPALDSLAPVAVPHSVGRSERQQALEPVTPGVARLPEATGPVLEEVTVPSRFAWRPAAD